MSKADTLRDTPAFGAARSARSSRRDAIRKVTGGDQAANEAITELPVTLVSENPDNPRNHLRNLDETVESVREVGIILPIVVATVDAYLQGRPDRAEDLDDAAQYVVVDGHRRLEASRRVGLATIPVRVDNARVATDEALLEAAFVANYHRDDMTDLEEAHALQSLVDYYGSQSKAAKRLGIPQGTISSKLSLLKLAPELQKDLATGARKVEHVRNLGKLTPEEQKAKADERAQAARRQPETPLAAEPVRQSGPANYHGVIIPDAGSAPAAPPVPAADTVPEPRHDERADNRDTATTASAEQEHPNNVPEPREAPPTPDTTLPPGQKRFPYEDGPEAARYLIHRMPQAEFDKMLDALLEHRAKQVHAAR